MYYLSVDLYTGDPVVAGPRPPSPLWLKLEDLSDPSCASVDNLDITI